MGNGESTARRIAMQRSDEGVVQISEDVMLRLSGKEKPKEDSKEDFLKEGELIIQEESLSRLLDEAYNKGRRESGSDVQKKLEELGIRALNLKNMVEKQQREMENLRVENQEKGVEIGVLTHDKDSLEKEKLAVELQIEQMRHQEDVKQKELKDMEDVWRKELDEREAHLNTVKKEFEMEREAIQQKASERESLLKDEFDRGIRSITNKLKPPRQITACDDFRRIALDCFKVNKEQSLRCSKQVSDFIRCIENTTGDVVKSMEEGKE